MDFMKRALQRQREEARQEAQKLIQALQEEKEFDEEFAEESDKESEKPEKLEKPEEEKEESSKASAIREALNGGVVRRAKHEGKSLEVKDPITVKPLFEAPAIPSLFDDDSAIPSSVQDDSAEPKGSGSHLLDELSEGEAGSEVESEADDALLDHPAENEPAGENPWLAAARDNVSHGERGAKEKEEDGVDVQAAVARLEVGKRGKPER